MSGRTGTLQYSNMADTLSNKETQQPTIKDFNTQTANANI